MSSFKNSRPGDRKGDYRGFVVAIDASFDAAKSPREGYEGWFNIIVQLVLTDLYALSINRGSQVPDAFWTLSMQHPWGVYVGPTTGVRRRDWRKLSEAIELWGMAIFLDVASALRSGELQ